MNTIVRISANLLQSMAVLVIVALGANLTRAETHAQLPSKQAVVAPQTLLQQVKAYELNLHDIPNDMTVTIVKKGSSPAEIHVEQGRMRYDSSEGSLAAFPRKVREQLERMFGITQHTNSATD